jgi:signal transduction histidine kinase
MEGMDGRELFQAVRADPRYADIPFIFITGRAEPESRQRLLADGAVDYIAKPFDIAELGFKLLNLTRRFEAERRRQEHEHRARLEIMLGGLSHEIKNPLSGVTGPAANLRRLLASASFADKEGAEKYLGAIERNSARIASLLGDVNAFLYRRDLGRSAFCVSALLRDLGEKTMTANPGLAVRLTGETEARVYGDQEAAWKVFENIILNAVDALGGTGAITVELRREGDKVRISIADGGPGISPENLGRVFDPFFTTKRLGKGLGLGLAVARHLARAMGWSLTASSPPGAGAVFSVRAMGA